MPPAQVAPATAIRAVRGARLASLAAIATIAIWIASAVLAALHLASVRATEVQDVRDGFWLSIQRVDALRGELLRAPRSRLDDWLAEVAAQPERRRPAAHLAAAGLLVVLQDGSRFRLAGAPADLPREGLQDRQWLAQLHAARDLVPFAGLWCLRLPESDSRAATGWVSDLGTSRLMLAACATTARLQAAAEASLPRSSELTFWRDRQGLVRITRLSSGKTEVDLSVGALHRDVLDRGRQAFDFDPPLGAWNLLASRGHTLSPLQLNDEERPTGRHRIMYVSRGDRAAGWTGYSLAFHDPVDPTTFGFWYWWSVAVLGLALASFPLAAWCAWRRIGRELTRAVDHP